MKKLLLLLPVIAFFASCSTGTEDFNEEAVSVTTDNAQQRIGVLRECTFDLSGSVYIDVSNGLNNPVAVFSANVSGVYSLATYFRVSLEIETLTDCEDLTSGSGTSVYYNLPDLRFPEQNVPVVSVPGQNLPANACYRWRFAAEQATSPRALSSCVKYTKWYDAPLF